MKWEKNVMVTQPKHRQENILLRSFTPLNAAIWDPVACARKWEPCAGLRCRGRGGAKQRNTDHMPPASWRGWAKPKERSPTVVCCLSARRLWQKNMREVVRSSSTTQFPWMGSHDSPFSRPVINIERHLNKMTGWSPSSGGLQYGSKFLSPTASNCSF